MNAKPESEKPTDLEAACELLATLKPGKPLAALLSTVSSEGRPHATWMFASRSTDPGLEILTITSPDSEKVVNLASKCKVEWLLSSSNRLEQLYLEGDAEFVKDVAEIKRLWNLIGGKEQAYFLKYYNSGMGFSIIRTRVTAVIYSLPEQYRKVPFTLDEILGS